MHPREAIEPLRSRLLRPRNNHPGIHSSLGIRTAGNRWDVNLPLLQAWMSYASLSHRNGVLRPSCPLQAGGRGVPHHLKLPKMTPKTSSGAEGVGVEGAAEGVFEPSRRSLEPMSRLRLVLAHVRPVGGLAHGESIELRRRERCSSGGIHKGSTETASLLL